MTPFKRSSHYADDLDLELQKKLKMIADLSENIDLQKKAKLSVKLSSIINGLQKLDGPINKMTDYQKRSVI